MNTHAQGIRIMQGTSFIPTSSTAYVVMADNAGFENNEPLTSTMLILKGTGTGTSDIKGTAILSVSGLKVDKTAGQVILRKNVSVDGTIDFSGGLLDLNTHKLSLSSVSTLQNESEGSRITGPLGGYVEITQELNAPLGTNPGNIGLAITSGSNMGSTTIRRS